MARLLVPERIAKTPELGEQGCTCTPADYIYTGDFATDHIVLLINGIACSDTTDERAVMNDVMLKRNVVKEMRAYLRCVKPIRAMLKELQTPLKIEFHLT